MSVTIAIESYTAILYADNILYLWCLGTYMSGGLATVINTAESQISSYTTSSSVVEVTSGLHSIVQDLSY